MVRALQARHEFGSLRLNHIDGVSFFGILPDPLNHTATCLSQAQTTRIVWPVIVSWIYATGTPKRLVWGIPPGHVWRRKQNPQYANSKPAVSGKPNTRY